MLQRPLVNIYTYIGTNEYTFVESYKSFFSWDNPELKEKFFLAPVEEFIRSQTRIGFTIDMSRNFGYQASIANQLVRIREMGFTGYAVIVFGAMELLSLQAQAEEENRENLFNFKK